MGQREEIARERLLTEAERLFMSHGYTAVSTRDICAAARVKQPTLYHYFVNKEALYLAIIQRWLTRFGRGIQQALAIDAGLTAQLHGIAVLFWEGPAGEYQAMQRDTMLHMPPDHLATIGQAVWANLLSPIVERFREAIAHGELPVYADPIVLMQLFWAVVDGASGIYRRGTPMPAPQANRSIIDFFLGGARSLQPKDYAQWPQSPHFAVFHQNETE